MNLLRPLDHHTLASATVLQIEAISKILSTGGQIPIEGTGIVLQGVKISFDTEHFLHAGLYSRTIHVPAGYMLCGTLIRVPTVLIISGDMSIYNGESWTRITGNNKTLRCSADRRGMGFAHEATDATMLFSTQAKSVKDAEKEFTEEWERLMPAKEI